MKIRAFTAVALLMPSSKTPDISLINELYDAIELNPPALEARRLLMQQFVEMGWFEAANDTAKELLSFLPTDRDAQDICDRYNKVLTQAVLSSQTVSAPSRAPSQHRQAVISKITDVDLAAHDLAQGCKLLVIRAKRLQQEIELLRNNEFLRTFQPGDVAIAKQLTTLDAIVGGRLSTTWNPNRPQAARAVAQRIATSPTTATATTMDDLVSMIRWLQPQVLSEDDMRAAIVKRAQAIQDVLPESLRAQAKKALVHVEHENLKRKYINDETMLGDPIGEIPRTNFFVSEDGYAWDMEELAQAIKSKDGVMRNPLSRQMFSTDDIHAIIEHPLGKGLAALRIAQGKLSKGVRPKTIAELENLAKILLTDQSTDLMPSHNAMEAFLSYVATLPRSEQESLEKLQISAKDSLNGRPFDTKILESIHDAKGNRTCTHKTGDFLNQAAKFLRQKK